MGNPFVRIQTACSWCKCCSFLIPEIQQMDIPQIREIKKFRNPAGLRDAGLRYCKPLIPPGYLAQDGGGNATRLNNVKPK